MLRLRVFIILFHFLKMLFSFIIVPCQRCETFGGVIGIVLCHLREEKNMLTCFRLFTYVPFLQHAQSFCHRIHLRYGLEVHHLQTGHLSKSIRHRLSMSVIESSTCDCPVLTFIKKIFYVIALSTAHCARRLSIASHGAFYIFLWCAISLDISRASSTCLFLSFKASRAIGVRLLLLITRGLVFLRTTSRPVVCFIRTRRCSLLFYAISACIFGSVSLMCTYLAYALALSTYLIHSCSTYVYSDDKNFSSLLKYLVSFYSHIMFTCASRSRYF